MSMAYKDDFKNDNEDADNGFLFVPFLELKFSSLLINVDNIMALIISMS